MGTANFTLGVRWMSAAAGRSNATRMMRVAVRLAGEFAGSSKITLSFSSASRPSPSNPNCLPWTVATPSEDNEANSLPAASRTRPPVTRARTAPWGSRTRPSAETLPHGPFGSVTTPLAVTSMGLFSGSTSLKSASTNSAAATAGAAPLRPSDGFELMPVTAWPPVFAVRSGAHPPSASKTARAQSRERTA